MATVALVLSTLILGATVKMGNHAGLPPNQQFKRFIPSSTVDRYEVPQQSSPPTPRTFSRLQQSSSLTDGATTSIVRIGDETSTSTLLTPTKNAQRRLAPQPPASSTIHGAKENNGFLSSVDEQSREATTLDSPFAIPGLLNVPSDGVRSMLKYDRNSVQNGSGKYTEVGKMHEKSQTLAPVGSPNGARKSDHRDSKDSENISFSSDTEGSSLSVEVDRTCPMAAALTFTKWAGTVIAYIFGMSASTYVSCGIVFGVCDELLRVSPIYRERCRTLFDETIKKHCVISAMYTLSVTFMELIILPFEKLLVWAFNISAGDRRDVVHQEPAAAAPINAEKVAAAKIVPAMKIVPAIKIPLPGANAAPKAVLIDAKGV